MTNWNIGDSDVPEAEANHLYWHKIKDGTKILLVCDRNILVGVSWDDLNSDNRVLGKTITIDGRQYKLRLLDPKNEWDHFVTNEEVITRIPVPTASDLDQMLNENDYIGKHNQFWNWVGAYSWVQDMAGNSGTTRVRGYSSPHKWDTIPSSQRGPLYGWRPVLEVNGPLAPSKLKPAGFEPIIVRTLTPTITWEFSDPDGDTQKRYQVIIRDGTGAIAKDSGIVSSVTSSYAVNTPLQSNTTYHYTVKVWDQTDEESPDSEVKSFKTRQAPTAEPIEPKGTSTRPKIVQTLTPRIIWKYDDSEGIAQQSYQVKIHNAETDVMVLEHDSSLIFLPNEYYDVPARTLTAGIKYCWTVVVTNKLGIISQETEKQYFQVAPYQEATVCKFKAGDDED
ncbi:glycoside hydrolase family 78 protein [Bacillus pseudomycoides]|uniref:glycoside hydrolase family 78 protein n=1 Tax=Bacillus pseudomycoides TaxID=64104 RepID=UPI001CD31F4F|nr:hypothetical protein [Bacillus pseudomycoides]